MSINVYLRDTVEQNDFMIIYLIDGKLFIIGKLYSMLLPKYCHGNILATADVMKKDLIDLTRFTKKEIMDLIDFARNIKANPLNYSDKLRQKTLLMIFEKPSLRTRVSFEVAMTELRGHAIYYDLANSPMGKKESVSDTAKTASRYVSAIMARLNSQEQIIELAQNSSVPVINGLTNFNHPVQILSDLLTISEKKRRASRFKISVFGRQQQ